MKQNKLLLSMFFRSFLLESIWNFERMQNIGFIYIILPLIRMLYPDAQKRKERIFKHLEFFNTHPYMASIIVGIVASMEKELVDKKTLGHDEISLIKTNMAGPLAAIGDTFFWSTWRSFSAVLTASIIIIFYDMSGFRGTWLAPLFFLTTYNLVHIPFRYWSLRISYHIRTRMVRIIAGLEFQHAVSLIQCVVLVILALTFIFYIVNFAESFQERILFILIFSISIFLGYIRMRPTLMFYAIVILSIILSNLSFLQR